MIKLNLINSQFYPVILCFSLGSILFCSCTSYKYKKKFKEEFVNNTTIYLGFDSLQNSFPENYEALGTQNNIERLRLTINSNFEKKKYKISDKKENAPVQIIFNKVNSVQFKLPVTVSDSFKGRLETETFMLKAIRLTLFYSLIQMQNQNSVTINDSITFEQAEAYTYEARTFVAQLLSSSKVESKGHLSLKHYDFDKNDIEFVFLLLGNQTANSLDDYFYTTFLNRNYPGVSEKLKRQKAKHKITY